MRDKILKLKQQKNAVILAHYYAPDEAQQVADYIGDSFYLAKVAKTCSAEIIVFCGVSFMGESAKILNPDKKVLMPDLSADCPMAHMASVEKIRKMRSCYDDLAVVCYINSSAKLKCESDICVTSSNALKIVQSLPNKNIFFIPDKNLGTFVKENVTDKNIILNDGYCPIHVDISAEDILAEKAAHPTALVLSHPECERPVLEMSDYIGSTAEIIDYAAKAHETEFIICTEQGVDYKLKTTNPDKKFYFPRKKPCCPDMKLNTLESILKVLETEQNEVIIDEQTRRGAIAPLDRMLELG